MRSSSTYTHFLVHLQAVKRLTIKVCKCHGISGSCEHKTCLKTMVPFDVVGTHLMNRYDNSAKVNVDQHGNDLVLANGEIPSKPSRDDLVFLEESPDYCVANPNTGSLGTTGRACNKSTPGRGSCGILCCGRGYNTLQVNEEYDCECKFHWCCEVKCKRCSRTINKHVCQ